MNLAFDPLNCPLQGRFLIEASAGTGKTYTLTLLYLRLLLGGWVKGAAPETPQRDITQILVVTFTKPATLELRGAYSPADLSTALRSAKKRHNPS